MSNSLSTIVLYGYTFTEDEAALIDQAQSHTAVGEGNALEWRSFGVLEYEGCGMALAVAGSMKQEYGNKEIHLYGPDIGFSAAWDKTLIEYLESIGVTPPSACPSWWAVSSYG